LQSQENKIFFKWLIKERVTNKFLREQNVRNTAWLAYIPACKHFPQIFGLTINHLHPNNYLNLISLSEISFVLNNTAFFPQSPCSHYKKTCCNTRLTVDRRKYVNSFEKSGTFYQKRVTDRQIFSCLVLEKMLFRKSQYLTQIFMVTS
jgi:hypothetical protein